MEFKKDQYRKTRGGYSRLLEIHCRKCNNLVTLYQKDGPGNLRRMYLDRMLSVVKSGDLKCGKCGEILGSRYVYAKEKRLAFRLYVDAVTKKVTKLNKK